MTRQTGTPRYLPTAIVASGAWTDENTYEAQVWWSKTPFHRTLTCRFTADGVEIAAVQIAGLIARRIVTFKGEGDAVGAGERYGLIRFGSRVDVYLPPGRTALVAVGQTMIGGETVIADLKSGEGEREARAG